MILFGFQHCGKSTFGAQLAEHLQMPFLDTDLLIEERVGDYRALWRQDPLEFRKVEKEVIKSLPAKTIIALGGGAILDRENREHLETLAPLVYIKIPKERLKARYADPLFFEKIYAERFPLYEAIPRTMIIDPEEFVWQAIR